MPCIHGEDLLWKTAGIHRCAFWWRTRLLFLPLYCSYRPREHTSDDCDNGYQRLSPTHGYFHLTPFVLLPVVYLPDGLPLPDTTMAYRDVGTLT